MCKHKKNPIVSKTKQSQIVQNVDVNIHTLNSFLFYFQYYEFNRRYLRHPIYQKKLNKMFDWRRIFLLSIISVNTHNFKKNLHDYITKALSQPIKPISPRKQSIIFALNLQNYGECHIFLYLWLQISINVTHLKTIVNSLSVLHKL